MSSRSAGVPGAGSPVRSSRALPSPDTALSSLMITSASWGVAPRSASVASGTLLMRSTPNGCGTPARANSVRAPLLVPSHAWSGSAIHRNVKRDVPFEHRHVVWQQVADPWIDERLADLLKDTGPCQELLTEGRLACVAERDQTQALARRAPEARRQERDVVVHGALRNRQRGHIRQLQPGILQLKQRAEHPLLVGPRLGRRFVPTIDRPRRQDDHRPPRRTARRTRRDGKPFLQAREPVRSPRFSRRVRR